jgi:hypothetical protein
MAQRNYPCDNLILGYFGREKTAQLEEVGEKAFQRQLYQCMLAQSLAMKSTIELQRATNTFGIMVWQLNEIWPTGGWGSLEYGTTGFTPGQVLGGRWRPLHHVMREHLFADVFATCGVNGVCFVKNDGITAFEGRVTVEALRISGDGAGTSTQVVVFDTRLPRGPGQSQWFSAKSWDQFLDGSFVFTCAVHNSQGGLASSHVILPAPPSDLSLSSPKLMFEIADEAPDGSVPITISASAPALFVSLTTAAHGHFSENSFLVQSARIPKTVHFLPSKEVAFDLNVLKKTLRIEDLASNMPSGQLFKPDVRSDVEIVWL